MQSDKAPIETIYERIKAVRNALGLSQADFVKPLGIKQGHYSDVERGAKKPSDTLLIAMTYRYAINPLWLYENKGEMFIGHGEVTDAASAMNLSEPDLKDIAEKIQFIYTHGAEDQRDRLYGRINSIFNEVKTDYERGPEKHGGQAEKQYRQPEGFSGEGIEKQKKKAAV